MVDLTLTTPQNADGQLAELYKVIQDNFGGVPEGLQLFGVSPTLLNIQLQSLQYFSQHKTISQNFFAMLRYILSEHGKCEFCIGFNKALLIEAGFTDQQIDQALSDPSNGPLSEKENALLDYVLRAIQNPHGVSEKDVKNLKMMGWSDSEIFDATIHGAQHVAIDTIFETFGIAPYA